MPECIEWNSLGLCGKVIFTENSGMNFVTVHFNSLRGFDPKTNLSSLGS